MSDEFTILPDEKELRYERRQAELEAFKQRTELERSKRELKRKLQVGTHMLRATAEMLDALIIDDFDSLCTDRKFMNKVMELMDTATEIQEALGNE